MHPNSWRNSRPYFETFGGGWNQDYPEPDYQEDMKGGYMDNRFGWQNNGHGGGPPRGGGDWRAFNPGPPMNWGPPPNFGGSPPNMFSWGRGFGPSGPPMHKPKKVSKPVAYLLRCGLPNERVMNLPREFLRLITPEHCGVCDISLESHTLSRAHFLSKSHHKKQNRWLSDFRKQKGRQLRAELPLSSRDFYCELCDVQITSKVHAASHYAGKSHRTIVEGGKKPKNKALLCKAMDVRVENLIRREKEIMESTKLEKTEDGDDPTKSELYCHICKTSVTCTDQMTMHLNGKKHLTREKQYILCMMKGDSKDEEKGNEEAEEAAEDEGGDNAEGEEGNEQEDGDDKYDWGNGSGAWEEDEKQ